MNSKETLYGVCNSGDSGWLIGSYPGDKIQLQCFIGLWKQSKTRKVFVASGDKI